MIFRVCLFCLGLCSVAVNADQQTSTAKTVTVAIDQTPSTFNPYADKHLISQQFKHMFFDPLLRWDKNFRLEKRLITGWQRINVNTMRFYLRRNLNFHSGNQLTSADVVWSFQQSIKLREERLLNKLSSIKVHDRFSFDIQTDISDLQLLDSMTYLFVLDSTFYQKAKGLLDTPPSIMLAPIKELPLSGTGPYQVYQYNPALGIEIIANKQYWDNTPQIDYFRFLKIKRPQSRLYALLADDVQVSYSIPNKKLSNILESKSKRLVNVPISNAIFLTINDQRSLVFSDKSVREAVDLAINQKGMLKHILNGRGRVHSSFMSLAEAEFLPSQKAQTIDEVQKLPVYDLKKSKKLLKNVQLPKQIRLLVMLDEVGNTEQAAVAIANMLNKVGIKVVVDRVNSKLQWEQSWDKYDLTISGWHTWLMSRENVYENLFHNSLLTGYLQQKFKQGKVADSYQPQPEFFDSLQRDDWLIPLLFQDKIWAENGHYNLQDIFSANGIPYWSLLKYTSD